MIWACLTGISGIIQEIDSEGLTCVVSFFPDKRLVAYKHEDISELDRSYAITIHKSQGSEFGAVIIPTLTQYFKILFRNLIYSGLTNAKKPAVLVGTRKALAMAVKTQDTSQRQTYLKKLLQADTGFFNSYS
jgi:exodeoxyribonuclease V alpha subunit